MRIYDVYRGTALRACIRIQDDGQIDWVYRPDEAEWQGFWWRNDDKSAIEQALQQHPQREELTISGFTIRPRPSV
jgi:hypothetical protein